MIFEHSVFLPPVVCVYEKKKKERPTRVWKRFSLCPIYPCRGSWSFPFLELFLSQTVVALDCDWYPCSAPLYTRMSYGDHEISWLVQCRQVWSHNVRTHEALDIVPLKGWFILKWIAFDQHIPTNVLHFSTQWSHANLPPTSVSSSSIISLLVLARLDDSIRLSLRSLAVRAAICFCSSVIVDRT